MINRASARWACRTQDPLRHYYATTAARPPPTTTVKSRETERLITLHSCPRSLLSTPPPVLSTSSISPPPETLTPPSSTAFSAPAPLPLLARLHIPRLCCDPIRQQVCQPALPARQPTPAQPVPPFPHRAPGLAHTSRASEGLLYYLHSATWYCIHLQPSATAVNSSIFVDSNSLPSRAPARA